MKIHEFYRNHIAHFKGEVEIWYQKLINLYTDLMLIFLTAWVIISRKSELTYKIFKELPSEPSELK